MKEKKHNNSKGGTEMKDNQKCWECGKKAKWENHYYVVKTGFHSTVYFCSESCSSEFSSRNGDRITRTASYHKVA